MARVAGVNLPVKKRIEFGLTYIFGIGLTSAREILLKTKVDPNKRVVDLTDAEIMRLQKTISDGYAVEGDLHRDITRNIRRLQAIKSYRGLRHKKGLPVWGQRTKTNARTRKGPRRPGGAVSLKRKVTKK